MATNSVDLSTLHIGVDDHRRDRWGRMLVVPPGGSKPEPYTRATTVAKATDEGGGLGPWKATAAVVGLMGRPGLRSRWETLISATKGDPWYASAASKAECKKLVEQCAEAGGSANRAEMGTSLHALIALVNVGEEVTGLSPETEADVQAYRDVLADAGITVARTTAGAPGVEVTVALHKERVAGTADIFADVPGFRRPMIADLKTGADLGYSWQSIAVQLAIYARADEEYWQGPDPNGSEDIRTPLPDLDPDHGLIIHLPAGEARAVLYVVDLAAGWEAFQLSMAVRSWRTRRDLAVPLPKMAARPMSLPTPLALVPELDEPRMTAADERTAAQQAARDAHPSTQPPSAPPLTAVSAPQSDDELRRWLQARIDVLGAHSDEARADLIASWPSGLAPLNRSTDHSAVDLTAIEAVLDDVEARNSVPFGPSRPNGIEPEHWLQRFGAVFPNTTVDKGTNP